MTVNLESVPWPPKYLKKLLGHAGSEPRIELTNSPVIKTYISRYFDAMRDKLNALRR